MVLINLLLSFLSRPVAYMLADYGLLLGYFFCRQSRKNVLANMEYLLRYSGDKTEGPEFRKKVRRLAKQMFINFGKQFYDMMMMRRYNEAALNELFDCENMEVFGRHKEKGKGVIGVTAHLSSWELCAMMIAMRYGTVNAVFMQHPNEGVNNFYIRQRAAKNVQAIMPGIDSFHRCVEALKRNEILAIVGDVDYASSGIETDFFGKRMRVPKGPPLLAMRSGAPMVCAAFLRSGNSRIHLEMGDMIEVPEEGDIDTRIRQTAKKYLAYFEKIILRDPSQWIVFNKFADLPPATGEGANTEE